MVIFVGYFIVFELKSSSAPKFINFIESFGQSIFTHQICAHQNSDNDTCFLSSLKKKAIHNMQHPFPIVNILPIFRNKCIQIKVSIPTYDWNDTFLQKTSQKSFPSYPWKSNLKALYYTLNIEKNLITNRFVGYMEYI